MKFFKRIANKYNGTIKGEEEINRFIEWMNTRNYNLPIASNELNYLFNTTIIIKRRIISQENKNNRIEDVIDLLKNYSPLIYKEFNRYVLYIETSTSFQLSKEEKDMLNKFINIINSNSNITIYGSGIDESLNNKLLLLLICCK